MKPITRHLLVLSLFTLCVGGVRAELLPYPVDTINGKAFYRYAVERSIGLYRISVNFSVTQEDILKYNPQLQSRGLRYDDVIIIPVTQQPEQKAPQPAIESAKPVVKQESVARQIPVQTAEKTVSVAPDKEPQRPLVAEIRHEEHPMPQPSKTPIDSLVAAIQSSSEHTAPLEDLVINNRPIRLAFLLPLHANAIERDKVMDRFYDFYAGALLAIYEQSEQFPIEVHTFDIEKTENKTKDLIESGQIDSMDFVIGTAYSAQVNEIVTWAHKTGKRVLVPFSNNVPLLAQTPSLWQFNPTYEMEAQVVVDSLKALNHPVQCILIDAPEEEIPQSIRVLREAIKANGIPYTMTSIHHILTDSVESALKDSTENIFLFNTTRYNIQILLPHLQALKNRYRITLLSQYNWQKERIPLPQMYVTTFSQHATPAYETLFGRFFHHNLASDMPRYDLLGYDLTNYVIHYIQHPDAVADEFVGLQSSLSFSQQTPLSGYKNGHILLIRKK